MEVTALILMELRLKHLLAGMDVINHEDFVVDMVLGLASQLCSIKDLSCRKYSTRYIRNMIWEG